MSRLSMLIVLAVGLAACSALPGVLGTPPTVAPPATATAALVTLVPAVTQTPAVVTATPGMAKPPQAVLFVGDQTQAAGVGTYCWSDPGSMAVCADMVGVPTSLEPLPVSAPFKPRFVMPLDQAPAEMVLTVFPVSADERDPSMGAAGGWRWWAFRHGNDFKLLPAREVEIELSPADPGLYVLSLFVRWDGKGDVNYGWLVRVQED